MALPRLNVLAVIEAVEKRYPLYDFSKKEYQDRVLKKRLWKGVCKEAYTPAVWNSLSPADRLKCEKEVFKRWNSLRNCFRRQLVEDKLFAAGKITKRKRKYIYFDELKFLLPFCEFEKTLKSGTTLIKRNEGSIKSLEDLCDDDNTENSGDDDEEIDICYSIQDDDDDIDADTTTIKEDGDEIEAGTSTMQDYNVEMITLPQAIQTNYRPETTVSRQDDDELFLRSLIPVFKEISGDQKLVLRMEIMKLIINFKKSLRISSNNPL